MKGWRAEERFVGEKMQDGEDRMERKNEHAWGIN